MLVGWDVCAGLYLALLAGGLVLLADERMKQNEVVIGLVAALLVLKPQLSFGLLLVMLFRRAWRAWAVMVLASVVLAAISVPILGVDSFPTWLEQMSWCGAALETASTTWWRQFTLYAFVRGAGAALGVGQGASRIVTASLGVPILLGGFGVIRRALANPERPVVVRALGLVVLVTVALNGYLFYYDALLLVVPALAAFAARGTYAAWARGVGHSVPPGMYSSTMYSFSWPAWVCSACS